MREIVNCPGLLAPPYGSVGHAREAWMIEGQDGLRGHVGDGGSGEAILPDGEAIAFA